MSRISTHVLDLTKGRPAAGIEVTLSRESGGVWDEITARTTDGDGRARLVEDAAALIAGRYRLHFATATYFRGLGVDCFHPYIEIAFEVADAAENYHVPLLLTPYGYSTYRGS